MRSDTAGSLLRIVLILGLVVLASFLPPDTSLQQVQRSGLLRACIPAYYPPLVTSDPTNPGLDVELVQAIAQELEVKAFLAVNPAMGTSFDPRSWNVTRSQCHLLAGGTVDTVTTRSFLEVTPPYLATGWMLVTADGRELDEGMRVGVFFSNANFDRIEVSRFLRAAGSLATPIRSAEQAERSLRAGELDGLLMEALAASRLAERNGWEVDWASEELTSYPLVLGLWKGDVTLKRAVIDAIRELETSGWLDRLRDRYGVSEIGQHL